MKHAPKTEFKGDEKDPPTLSMMEAMTEARTAVTGMTGIDIDSVVQCQRDPSGIWNIALDVIESPARMGDNDLLATYEVQIAPGPELISYNRLRRYHREDKDG